VQRRLEIEVVVIDEHGRAGTQLQGFDQRSKPWALGLPIHARQNEVIPNPCLAQDPLDGTVVIPRTDRADDAAIGERSNQCEIRGNDLDPALGQRALL
jgi:hypothetical protein